MLSRSAIACLLVAAVATAGCDRKSDGTGQAPARNAAAAATSPDEVAPGGAPAPAADRIDRSHKGEAAPAFAFQDAAGATHTLADFRGRPVLVNLWATWCGPCVRELPTLDALAAREGKALHVIAISQDMDAAKAATFWKPRGFRALALHTDPKMAWLPAVTANLPTTILYDAQGREVWRRMGDTDWAGSEAKAAIAEAG